MSRMSEQQFLDTTEPIIKLIPQDLYHIIHREKYRSIPEYKIKQTRAELARYELTSLYDDSELVNLPIPLLSRPLDEWIEWKITLNYQQYFEEADLFRDTIKRAANFFEDFKRPTISPYEGWSKFTDGQWQRCKGIPTESVVFDFETAKKTKNGQPKPFMCSAIDWQGIVYSWVTFEANWDNLEFTVPFGDQVKLLIGHNCVSYDRRFVKDFYTFAHDKRMLDTFSFYHVCLGMSKEQSEKFRIFEHLDTKLPWMKHTCKGGLSSLAKFLCGIDLDKSIRERFLSGKTQLLDEESDLPNGRESLEEYQAYNEFGTSIDNSYGVQSSEAKSVEEDKPIYDNYSEIQRNISDIWDYCLNDTIATACVFEKLYSKVSSFHSKIYLAGQLERSTLRINVDPNIDDKIDVVEKHNRKRLKEINGILKILLQDKIKKNNPVLTERIEGNLLKDYYERIFKSASFPYKTDLEQYKNVNLPHCLICIGWEEDTENTKKSVTKNKTVLKLKAVHYALENGYKTKIHKGKIDKWLKTLFKKPNHKIDEPFISLAGKEAPGILGIKWNGHNLVTRGNTWGIVVNGEFQRLPHPKGAGKNVGTPLGKEFYARVKAKEFKGDINLVKFFDDVSETTLWEKFIKRFESIFTVDDVWLPEIVPSGTVTGRLSAPLAVVMANTQSDRAGSEMKLWFRVADGHTKISADYSGQESEIFTAHIDAKEGHSGLNVYSCIVHAGKQKDETDIHNVVSKMLSKTVGIKIKRKLAKNMNFANQFLCGAEKLGLMVYLGLDGAIPMERCIEIAVEFQNTTRGKQNYGRYEEGMASLGFNRLKEMAKEPGQHCRLTYRPISAPLDAKAADWVNNEGKKVSVELTTRVNYSIQGTGQGLIDICMIMCRILANEHEILFNPCILIHDEFHADTLTEHAKDFAWIFQVSHFFSKALMYKRFGVQGMPLNKMWFESVELDTYLRKTPKDAGVTPSNSIPYPHLWFPGDGDYPENKYNGQQFNTETLAILSAKECYPSERIMQKLYTYS